MSQKQIGRYVVILKGLEGNISVKEAAEALNLEAIRQLHSSCRTISNPRFSANL